MADFIPSMRYIIRLISRILKLDVPDFSELTNSQETTSTEAQPEQESHEWNESEKMDTDAAEAPLGEAEAQPDTQTSGEDTQDAATTGTFDFFLMN